MNSSDENGKGRGRGRGAPSARSPKKQVGGKKRPSKRPSERPRDRFDTPLVSKRTPSAKPEKEVVQPFRLKPDRPNAGSSKERAPVARRPVKKAAPRSSESSGDVTSPRAPRAPRVASTKPLRAKDDALVRLHKYLAECGVGSRRKMERLIVQGRVQVNNQVVTELGRKIDPENDKVEVNRVPVKAAPKGIVLLNKPRGVVSTLDDPEGRPTVADFLTKNYRGYFPVGRLDWDTTGLIILTNDGEIAELLMHPRYQFDRIYHARVEGSVSQAVLDKAEQGIRLSDGIAYAVAEIVDTNQTTTWVEVRVREGRNRLVRRLFDKLGHSVVKLKRVGYGPFKLGKLDVGEVRPLTHKEYLNVRRKVLNDAEAPKGELSAEEIARSRVKKVDKKKRTRWSE